MTIIISRAGIEGTDIKPDSPEWMEWFASQPEGIKIQFTWTDDSFKEQKFTAYRRKRYWEAQKRISGKLRNTTIKPGEATYEALRQMGLKLTSYNWADKFEYEESGKGENYQTPKEVPSQTGNEIEELRARLAELEQSNSELQAANQTLEKQLSECSLQADSTDKEEIRRLNAELRLVKEMREDYRSKWEQAKEDNGSLARELKAQLKEKEAKLSEAVARILELEPLQVRIAGLESTIRDMGRELLNRPYPQDLIRRKVAELGMQEQLMQHQQDSKKAVRYWALAKLLESLETSG
jgi:predicted RNase H-like nuclease (RuvC/YqgF family)